MQLKSLKYRYCLTMLILLLASQAGMAQMKPVIEHRYRIDLVPLLEISALEPEISRLTNIKEARSLYESLESQATRLRPESGIAGERLRKVFLDAAALIHFYTQNRHLEEAEPILKATRPWLIDYARRFQQSSDDKRYSLIAQYYQLIGEYGRDQGRGSAVTRLIDLRKALAQEKNLASNIDLLVAYSLISISATRQQGQKYLAQATATSAFGNIASRLLNVMIDAKIDSEGRSSGQAAADGLRNMNYVAQVARGVPVGIQEPIFNTLLFIWQKAYQGSQARPPFSLEGLGPIKAVDAYLEGEALAKLAAGQVSAALASYQSIAKGYQGELLEISLNQRIWQIELEAYQRTRQSQPLENRFGLFHEKYGNNLREGSSEYRKKAQEFYNSIRNQYRRFVMQKLAEALQAQQAAPEVPALVERYLKYETARRRSYPIKLRLAQLYRKMSQHQRAVDIYLDMARDTPLQAYQLAVEAQSVLAQWPANPPWQQLPPAGNQGERTKLLEIYEKINQLKKNEDWQVLAHMGLLYQSLGQQPAQEKLWLARLSTASANPHSQEAAGRLASIFYQNKRWLEVIQLIELLKQRKIAATQNMQALPLEPLLADALFFQGQDDFQKRNHNSAIKHLNQFVSSFANEARVPAAFYSLGLAYFAVGRLTPALNTFKVLVDRFPKLENRAQVLLQGGQWASTNQQAIEYAFFFYGKYLREFSTASNIPQIRELLANLYFQRKLYGWASRLYREQSLAAEVPPAMQINAAQRYMEIEEQYGQAQDAAFGAQRILQLAPAGSPAAAKAYAFLARFAASRGDLEAMKNIEPQLLQMSGQFADAREALGHIRFKMAEMQTKVISNQEGNAFLRDPEGAIKQFFELFEQEKQHYGRVCQAGMSSYCAPSLLRLVQLSKMAIEAIRKVEIASTLGQDRINAFNVFKQLHLSKIQEQERNFARESLRLAQQGTTSDLWRAEIMKTLGQHKFQAAN